MHTLYLNYQQRCHLRGFSTSYGGNCSNFRGQTGIPTQPRCSNTYSKHINRKRQIFAKSAAQIGADSTQQVKVSRLVMVVPSSEENSPYGAPWQEVALHTANLIKWTDGNTQMDVISDSQLQNQNEQIIKQIQLADILVMVGIKLDSLSKLIIQNANSAKIFLAYQSSESLQNHSFVGSLRVKENQRDIFSTLLSAVPLTPQKSASQLLSELDTYWHRYSSDDLMFFFLRGVSEYCRPVPYVENTKRQLTPEALLCIAQNCSKQVIACVTDKNCKAALDCLDECAVTDQVGQYQCIVSYESPLLRDFSLYVLQKHNCLRNTAEIPMQPQVDPMTHFRGEELTWEASDAILLGQLGPKAWSWRVVAGRNPAYDKFPCQYQLFYRARSKNSMWYDPVFKVSTITRPDRPSEQVWRRRHYRVRRGDVVGTYHLSVLDNGVTSEEFWRVVGAADDLDWALLYYAGAAKAAGQAYRGAVLVTSSGDPPAAQYQKDVNDALERCSIPPWELYYVKQTDCSGAPLGVDKQFWEVNNLQSSVAREGVVD